MTNYNSIGTSGLNRQGSFVDEEFLRELKNDRCRRVFREMADNDPVVGAILFGIEYLVRGVDWRVAPVDDSAKAKEVSQFISSCIEDLNPSWECVVSDIMTMLVFGFAPLEIVYKKREGEKNTKGGKSKFSDGKIGWSRLSLRAQETVLEWEFDDNNDITGLIQQAPPKYKKVIIPAERFLLFRTTTAKNNPECKSVLRNAWRSWYIKKIIEEIEAIGVERDLAGLPVAYVPPNILSSTSDDAVATLNAMKDLVTNIKRNEQEGIVFPLAYDEETGKPLYDLKLLSTGGVRSFDTDKIISRYDQRIAMSLFADFILLGHENVGSKALGVTKIELFETAIETWCKTISEVFNNDAFPKLLRLNGYDLSYCPKLTYSQIKHVDLETVATYVDKLSKHNFLKGPEKEIEAAPSTPPMLKAAPPQDKEEEDVPEDEKEDSMEEDNNSPHPKQQMPIVQYERDTALENHLRKLAKLPPLEGHEEVGS